MVCFPGVSNSGLSPGPSTHQVLKFQRPLRFGSGLVATIPSKVTSFVLLLIFVQGVLCILLLLSQLTRRHILGNPVSADELRMLSFVLPFCLLYYCMLLAFVSMRHLASHWVRATYLTDRLPWYVRALYHDKLPSDAKVIMILKRVCNAVVTRLIYKHEPYDIRADRPGGRRISLLLGRIMPLWRRRPHAVPTGQEYADDQDSDVTLLPISESDPPFQDSPLPSSPSIELNANETDAFDCVSRETAVRLRLIQRALVETRDEDTGHGFLDGIAAIFVAGMWMGRFDSRRGVLDFLYDVGVPLRRRRGPGNGWR